MKCVAPLVRSVNDPLADIAPTLSVIVPASNEEVLIGRCLRALAATDWDTRFEVIVVANGCRDGTAERARAMAAEFAARGCTLHVIELSSGASSPR